MCFETNSSEFSVSESITFGTGLNTHVAAWKKIDILGGEANIKMPLAFLSIGMYINRIEFAQILFC